MMNLGGKKIVGDAHWGMWKITLKYYYLKKFLTLKILLHSFHKIYKLSFDVLFVCLVLFWMI